MTYRCFNVEIADNIAHIPGWLIMSVADGYRRW